MIWCTNCQHYNNGLVNCGNCGTALMKPIATWNNHGTSKGNSGQTIQYTGELPSHLKEGTKHDAGKPDLTLIRYDAIEQIARVFAFGAKKYGRNNYLAGMSHTRLLAAALRHIYAYIAGSDLDIESQESHLAHAGCCILMMLTYRAQNLGTDDRDVVPPKKES